MGKRELLYLHCAKVGIQVQLVPKFTEKDFDTCGFS